MENKVDWYVDTLKEVMEPTITTYNNTKIVKWDNNDYRVVFEFASMEDAMNAIDTAKEVFQTLK